MSTVLAAEAGGTTARNLTITLFLVFVAVTLAITIWASRQTKTATDFYAGGRSFSGFQNGMAIGGDYMSAASFLGIAGIIALYGYDGFLYSIGFLVAWLVALLLVAELLRNSGRYTMADVLAFRMRQRPVRTAAAVSTITVSIFYLLAQMVGAGALVALLLGIKPGTTFLGMDADTAKVATIIMVGALMIIYVTVGGMKGTTYVQIVKAFLLMGGALVMTLLVLAKYKFNLSSLLGDAAAAVRQGRRLPRTRPAVRRGGGRQRDADLLQQDGPALARHRAGARHRRPAAHPDPLLHRADRQGGPEERALGDRHHRHLLPADPGPRLRRGGAGRQPGDHRAGQGRQHRRAAAGRGARRGLLRRRPRRGDPAGDHRGGRLRHHPGGGRRADPGLLVQPGARLLRQRDQERAGVGAAGGARSPGSPPWSSARSRSRCRSSRRA